MGLGWRLWLVRHAPAIAGDSLLYGEIAQHWLRSGVYGFAESGGVVQPTLLRLPGYPLFLLLSFRMFGSGNYRAVMLLQVVVDLGTWLLLSVLVRRLLGRREGMAALLLGVLCPFPAMYVSVLLAETLTLFSIVLAFFSLERWRARGAGWNGWLLPLTFALAYGLLLRPEQGLLAAAVVPAMVWIELGSEFRRERAGRVEVARLVPMLVVAVGTLLPLVPWMVRNWETFHVIEPLAPRYAMDPGEVAPMGFQRWFRTWGVDFASTEDVYWTYDGSPVAVGDLPRRAFDSPAQYAQTAELLGEYNVTLNPTPELDARFGAIAEDRVRAHPLRYYVGLPVARLLNMIFRPRTETLPIQTRWWRHNVRSRETIFAAGWAVLNLLYFVLGGIGLQRVLGRVPGRVRVVVWAMVGFALLRCLLLLTLDNSEPRYTLEFFPVLVVGVSAMFGRRKGLEGMVGKAPQG